MPFWGSLTLGVSHSALVPAEDSLKLSEWFLGNKLGRYRICFVVCPISLENGLVAVFRWRALSKLPNPSFPRWDVRFRLDDLKEAAQ